MIRTLLRRRRHDVVRANGEVVANTVLGWFRRGGGWDIRPGDTIVVPIDVDQPLVRWSAIARVVYTLAIATATLSSA